MSKNIKLNNGEEIPSIGFGTYMGKELEKNVQLCIDLGYKLFDTAFRYRNEKQIGTALSTKFKEGKLRREDVFIVSKLSMIHHKPKDVLPAIKKSLSDLQLQYLNLYLIHFPVALKSDENDLNNLEEENVPIEDTWRAMEELVKLGLTKSIGLSNFNSIQIERILKIATIRPVVNQVECNIYFNQKRLIEFCKQREIVVMAYSPFLGNPGPYRTEIEANIFEELVVNELSKRYNKSCGQIMLKYLSQLGTVPIPKSNNIQRISENIDIFDFTLTSEEMEKLDSLNKNIRSGYSSVLRSIHSILSFKHI